MVHETIWKPENIGASAAQGRGTVRAWVECVRSGTPAMSPTSFVNSCITSAARSSCCGTRGAFTRGRCLPSCTRITHVFTPSGFPDMRRNSIRSNSSGATTKDIQPTSSCSTSKTSDSTSTGALGEFAAPRIGFVHSFLHQTFHHHRGELSIT